jgi:hypothetical protein
MSKKILLFLLSLMVFSGVSWAQVTAFSDDFTTSQGATYTIAAGAIGTSSTWSMARLGADWGARINNGVLDLTNDGSAATNVAGWVFGYTATGSFSSYNTSLSSNTGTLTWTFNMKTTRSSAISSYAAGSYGVGVILGGTSTSAATAGTGYAVILKKGTTYNAVSLISYASGLQGTQTTIIGPSTDLSSNTAYVSVKVTYVPSTNTWALFYRDDGATAADPTTGTLTQIGSNTVNNVYTSTPLPYFGGYFQGNTGANQTGLFDNVLVTVTNASSPLLTETGTLTAFGNQLVGGSSAEQTYTIAGSNLTGDIVITPPTGFQVSTTTGTGFGSSVTLTPSGGSVSTTTIYVRFTPPAALSYSGNITNATSGATTKNVAASGVGVSAPAATSSAATSVTSTTAQLNGSVTANNSSTTVTFEYGSDVSYGSSVAATPATVTGTTPTSVSAALSGLSLGATYHYRVKAVNSYGTTYGSDQTFTTVMAAPAVTTTSVTSITATTASSGGNVTSDGGSPILHAGVCWKTSAGATASDSHTDDAAATGAFTSSVTGLLPNTTYYINSYATNAVGTSYGTETSFTTLGLTAPSSVYASDFSTTGFTANWSAVAGATSYQLDVSTLSAFGTLTPVLSEDFALFTNGSIGSPDGTNRAASLDTYMQTAGWSGLNIYMAGGAIKLGSGSGQGVLTTPTIDLSANSGNASLKFDLQNYGSDNTIVQVFLSTNGGSSFTQIGSDITPTGTLTTKTISITGGTATSQIKIAGKLASSNRFYLDNFVLSSISPSYLAGYSNLTVSGTSSVLTGLTPNTSYSFRVRSFAASSTSLSSSTVTVGTPNLVQPAVVPSGSSVTTTVGSSSGVKDITFTTVNTGGNVNVSHFTSAPASTTGITGNVSAFRWVIQPDNSLAYDQAAGYTVRFSVADMSGIAELADGDNSTIKLYKRSTPGSGTFTDEGYMTYHRNGTDGDQSDDYLVSALITDGFSEFALGSGSEPLPVELTSFSASVDQHRVVLNWKTATEINTNGFSVLRSADKTNWKEIGFIKASGNSNTPLTYRFVDQAVANGSYTYKLKMVDNDGTYKFSSESQVTVYTPNTFELAQNYPNPFNPSTMISYSLATDAKVTLKVYNALGSEVATVVNELQSAGPHAVSFSADQYHLSSGIYFYKIQAGNFSETRRMMLLK